MPPSTRMTNLPDPPPGFPTAGEPIPGIVTGGHPSAAHLDALRRAGCEVVLDIREPMEPQPFRPGDAVAAAGLEYLNIPVSHGPLADADRKSTRLNSSHLVISYAVFCLKKKKNENLLIRHGNSTRVLPSFP